MNPASFSGLAHARASVRGFAQSRRKSEWVGERKRDWAGIWAQSVRYFQLPNRFVTWLLRLAVACSRIFRGKWQMANAKRFLACLSKCYYLLSALSLSVSFSVSPPPATLMASFRARRHLSGIFGTCCEYFSSQLAARTVINGISVREQMWLKLPNQKHIELYIRHLT